MFVTIGNILSDLNLNKNWFNFSQFRCFQLKLKMSIVRVHLRVIMYDFRRETGISNTVKNICDVFEKSAVSIPTCERWFAKIKRGDFNLEDQLRSGRSSNVDDDIVRNLVDTNTRISTQIVAKKLKIDRSTAFRHLKNLDTI